MLGTHRRGRGHQAESAGARTRQQRLWGHLVAGYLARALEASGRASLRPARSGEELREGYWLGRGSRT